VKGVIEYSSKSIALATGWDHFNAETALAIGERMVHLQRLIAVRRGFTPQDEYDISERLLEAPTYGKAAGQSIRPHLKRMVEEYYDCMGWDKATARPTPATLQKVRLPNI
jgi:aldehyde:ferredoxin oxidoreductase